MNPAERGPRAAKLARLLRLSHDGETAPGARHRSEAVRGDPKPENSRSAAAKPEPCAAKRILLVDDDAGVRDSLAGVLIGEGYLVLPAADGAEAELLAESNPVDLVLLDLNLPRKCGWETFQRLTSDHPLVPIIIVTGRAAQLFTAAGAGAGALIEKPVAIPKLLQVLRELMAEPPDDRLARLAGRGAVFRYLPSSEPNDPDS